MNLVPWKRISIFAGARKGGRAGEHTGYQVNLADLMILTVRPCLEPDSQGRWEIEYWGLGHSVYGMGHQPGPAEAARYPDVRAAMLAARGVAIQRLKECHDQIVRLSLEPPSKEKRSRGEQEVHVDPAPQNVQNSPAGEETPPAGEPEPSRQYEPATQGAAL